MELGSDLRICTHYASRLACTATTSMSAQDMLGVDVETRGL
jgi:hypothetical protein